MSCLTDGKLAYRGTWAIETSYSMDLNFLPAKMQYFSVLGRANFYGPKGERIHLCLAPRQKLRSIASPSV